MILCFGTLTIRDISFEIQSNDVIIHLPTYSYKKRDLDEHIPSAIKLPFSLSGCKESFGETRTFVYASRYAKVSFLRSNEESSTYLFACDELIYREDDGGIRRKIQKREEELGVPFSESAHFSLKDFIEWDRQTSAIREHNRRIYLKL